MPLFPKVQSPCPYKGNLSTVVDGDHCRMCDRQVVDLTAWSDGERRAFLSACQDEVCVSYRLPLRAAAIAAAFVAVPALAAAQEPASPATVEVQADPAHDVSGDAIIVGGIRNPNAAEFVAAPEDESVPELPVVVEDAPTRSSTPAAKDRPAADLRAIFSRPHTSTTT